MKSLVMLVVVAELVGCYVTSDLFEVFCLS